MAGSPAAASAAGRILVFGGRGLVGSAVCRELVRRGVQGPILSLSRTPGGQGPGGKPVEGVEYRGGIDALKPETFSELLPGARAVVISIGEPPWVLDRDRAMRSNGLTNTSIIRAAAEHRVPRVILVNATMPQWGLISGYREGKELAEKEALGYQQLCGDAGPDCGVLVIKPSSVLATRYAGAVPIPLGIVLAPMRVIFKVFNGLCNFLERQLPSLLAGVLRPPVHAHEIAKAAADGILADEFRGVRTFGTEDLVGYEGRPTHAF